MNAWNYRPGVAALQRADPINRPQGGSDPVPEPGTGSPPPPPITPVVSWGQREIDRIRRAWEANPNWRQPSATPSATPWVPGPNHRDYRPARTALGTKPAKEPVAPVPPEKRGAFNAAAPR